MNTNTQIGLPVGQYIIIINNQITFFSIGVKFISSRCGVMSYKTTGRISVIWKYEQTLFLNQGWHDVWSG